MDSHWLFILQSVRILVYWINIQDYNQNDIFCIGEMKHCMHEMSIEVREKHEVSLRTKKQ